MKKIVLNGFCGLVFALGGAAMLATPAAANTDAPQSIAQPPVAPAVAPKVAPQVASDAATDFSDGDFKSADQEELGTKKGGDTVIIGSSVVVVVILVVLLLILI